jgi:hypothetical protein
VFHWSISLGDVLVLVSLFVGVGGALLRWEGLTRRLLIEHETLMRDYCQRHEIRLTDLPTRSSIYG